MEHDPCDESDKEAIAGELREEIDSLLNILPVRTRRLLELRFGLTDDGYPRTMEEVAGTFNISRERVRQIEAKALRWMRNPKRSRLLVPWVV